MPVRYICRKCGRVLWSFTRVGQDYFGVPTPDEVRRMYGVCPTCKREFEDPSLEDIVIQPIVKKLVSHLNIGEVTLDALDVTKTTKSEEELIASQEA